MKTTGTQFQVVVNRELFASGVIDRSGQFEITLVNQPGVDGAVVAVTASTSSAPDQLTHSRTDSKVLSAGDSVAITLEEVKSGVAPMIAFRSGGITENPHLNVPKFCSFCGKEKLVAQKMVAGPNVFICDECIEMCHEIVHET